MKNTSKDYSAQTSRGGYERRKSPPERRRQNAPLSFKEKLKQSLMEIQKQGADGTLKFENMDPVKLGLLRPNEKPSILALASNNPLSAMGQGGKVTPQQALLQTMAVMHQKVRPPHINPKI
jgi:hypothetical protein